MPSHRDHIACLEIDVSVIKGRDLVAKDRTGVMRKKNSSDPYVEVSMGGKSYGKTKVIDKSLSPTWNETFQIKLGADEALNIFNDETAGMVHLQIFDKDSISEDDPMGVAIVSLQSIVMEQPTAQWYKVVAGEGKNACHNASGELQVKVTVSGKKMKNLVRGNNQRIVKGTIRVGLGWEMEDKNNTIDLDTSCVVVDTEGQISMTETVYYGNLSNPNKSIRHSGDVTTGEGSLKGSDDDEAILIELANIPKSVLAMYFVLTVATPRKSFKHVTSATVKVTNVESGIGLCSFTPHTKSSHTSMFLFRLAKEDGKKGWTMSIIEGGNSTARDFGSLIPEIKGYTRDIAPWVEVDPEERMAVLRKEGTIRVADYCSLTRDEIPDNLTFGLSWDVTNGVNIDLDASAICLDRQLNVVDLVYFKNLQSKDGSIKHGGDEREGDEKGDDEQFTIHLNDVDETITYVAFVVNSYSGQELDDVKEAACHLYDQAKGHDICKYTMTGNKQVDKHNALIVACLYRDDKQRWGLRIVSKPSFGKVARELIPDLQQYLSSHPPAPPTLLPDEDEIQIDAMPDAVPAMSDKEIKVEPLYKMENLAIKV